MKCELVPVTHDNLNVLAELAADPYFNMPRSVRWFDRMLFNDAIEECRDDPVRGYMLKNDKGEYVGMQCLYPVHLYLGRRKILAYSVAMLGIKRKYVPWLSDLMGACAAQERGCFDFGNATANGKAVAVGTQLGTASVGPKEGEYAYMHVDMASCIMAVFRRLGVRNKRFMSLLWKLLQSVQYVCSVSKSKQRLDCPYVFNVYDGFSSSKFNDFWHRFLNSNKGLISGREPATLRHYFDESIKVGTVILIAAESKSGTILGYVLLRKYRIYELDNMIKYKIIDICAVGNDIACLKSLVEYSIRHAKKNHVGRVEYIGANPYLDKWLTPMLKYRRPLNHPTFTYSCPADKPELKHALESRQGWFFGPYDGERCLGHGEYIDL